MRIELICDAYETPELTKAQPRNAKVCPTGLEPVWSGFQSDALTISARDT